MLRYLHTDRHAPIPTYTHTYIQTCIHTYKHTCIHTYIRDCKFPYVLVLGNTRTHTLTRARTHAHTHTYTYTHTQDPAATPISSLGYRNGWAVAEAQKNLLRTHTTAISAQMLYKLAQVWMSNVPHEWVMSRMNESCPAWMSHVPHGWVVSLMNVTQMLYKLVKVQMGHVPYEWVMSLMNESCPLWISQRCFTSHKDALQGLDGSYRTWMSRVSHECHINAFKVGADVCETCALVDESCRVCEAGMSHMNVTQMLYKLAQMWKCRVHTCMSRVTCMNQLNESCPTWMSRWCFTS